ncbi:MAG: hypothetical protein ACN6OP_03985 [Pseudomonadales bacterium]
MHTWFRWWWQSGRGFGNGQSQADLAAERQGHAATQARLEAGRAELDAAGRQLAELRTQFSTELERAHEEVTLAQEPKRVTLEADTQRKDRDLRM